MNAIEKQELEDLIEDDEPRDEEQEIINTNNIATKQKYRKTILEKFGDTLKEFLDKA